MKVSIVIPVYNEEKNIIGHISLKNVTNNNLRFFLKSI